MFSFQECQLGRRFRKHGDALFNLTESHDCYCSFISLEPMFKSHSSYIVATQYNDLCPVSIKIRSKDEHSIPFTHCKGHRTAK
ncbi:hypothetical protein EMIT0P294_10214 [Pseudomonas sp. IT-P294]